MKLSLEQKIAAAEQKKLDAEKELNDLKATYNEREEKAKNDRIFKRGNLWEDLMPDIAKLTHTQFKTFLENTVLNPYGQRELAKLLTQSAPPATPKSNIAAPKPTDTTARTDTTPAAKPAQTAQGGVTSSNGNTPNNTQQTS